MNPWKLGWMFRFWSPDCSSFSLGNFACGLNAVKRQHYTADIKQDRTLWFSLDSKSVAKKQKDDPSKNNAKRNKNFKPVQDAKMKVNVKFLCKFDTSCVIKTRRRLAVHIWSRHPQYKAVPQCCRYLGRESRALLWDLAVICFCFSSRLPLLVPPPSPLHAFFSAFSPPPLFFLTVLPWAPRNISSSAVALPHIISLHGASHFHSSLVSPEPHIL